jgi:hypothetical protein
MLICLPCLTHSFHTVYKIIRMKVEKNSFFPILKGYSRVLEAKKTIFKSMYWLRNFKFLFLGELSTCQQNLIPTRRMEPWKKHHFTQRSMLKFTYKGRFLTLRKAYGKFLDWKSKQCAHALVPLLHMEVFCEKNQNLYFWWNFKVSWTNCLWVDFGSFGQILLHWQWLTTCPNFIWNLKNLITFEL